MIPSFSISCMPSINELFVTSKLAPEKKTLSCVLQDPSNERYSLYNIFECLLYAEAQYYGNIHAESYESYSVSDIVVSECFDRDQKHQVLEYTVYCFSDRTNGNFFCVTDYVENNFRPLFKDYELFMIWNLVDVKQYYQIPLLLALQRSVYIFLMGIVNFFEFKGSLTLPLYWCTDNPKKEYYDLFSSEIFLSFDFTETGKYSNGTERNTIKLKLGIPANFKRDRVKKSDFESREQFFNAFWKIRIERIHKIIYGQLFPLYCYENIDDIF